MKLGRRIALDPTVKQEVYFWRAAGTARKAWNWALDRWKCDRAAWQAEIDPERRRALRPNSQKYKALWSEVRRTEFPWSLEVTKCAGVQAILDLGATFDRAIKESAEAKRQGRRPRPMFGFPRFKAKHRCEPAFAIWNDQLRFRSFNGKTEVGIPNLGWVRLREPLPSVGGILGARVRYIRGRWFLCVQFDTDWNDGEVSDKSAVIRQAKARKAARADGASEEEAAQITVEVDRPERYVPLHPSFNRHGGIDSGLRTQAEVLIEGDAEGVAAERIHIKATKRRKKLDAEIRRAQRRFNLGLARKRKSMLVQKRNGKLKRVYAPLAKGERPVLSNRDRKRLQALRRLEWRAANQWDDDLHKATTDLARRCGVLVGEDLNVAGMMKTNLARSVADASMARMLDMLDYKCQREGGLFVRAPRFFPSTKRCSGCGVVNREVGRDVVAWACPGCGATHDRDENAAANLAWLARLVVMVNAPAAFSLARKADADGRAGLEAWLFEARERHADLVRVRDEQHNVDRGVAYAPLGDDEAALPGSAMSLVTGSESPVSDGKGFANQIVLRSG